MLKGMVEAVALLIPAQNIGFAISMRDGLFFAAEMNNSQKAWYI